MHTVAETKNYADLLEALPGLSSCPRNAVEDFAANGVVKVRCTAGRTLTPPAHQDQNVYVLVSGSALLDAGDNIVVALEPGDYFGGTRNHTRHLVASVLAVSDVELLVFNPRDVARLADASSRESLARRSDHHFEWPTAGRRAPSRSRGPAVLAG
jgi:CRP-like cAMP-binding protein